MALDLELAVEVGDARFLVGPRDRTVDDMADAGLMRRVDEGDALHLRSVGRSVASDDNRAAGLKPGEKRHAAG